MVALAACVMLACVTAPAPEPIAIDEIVGSVAPPGPGVVDAAGERQFGASPLELQAAGDFYYRAGELGRARALYAACASAAEAELRAACHWGIGAVLVTQTRDEVAEGLREAEGCIRKDPPAPLECTEQASWFDRALSVLRIAYRGHPTARRAFLIAAIYEQLGADEQALSFYARGLALDPDDDRLGRALARLHARGPRPACPSCPPQLGVEPASPPSDCPALPFGWHRRTGELEIVGSDLEGLTQARVLACMGEPRLRSAEGWSYVRSSCTQTLPRGRSSVVKTTLRLYFEGDLVARVTHDRVIEDRECEPLMTSF